MDIWHILGYTLIIVLIYWFKPYLKKLDLPHILLGVASILGGVFSASLLLFIIGQIGIQNNYIYSSLFGPILEELIKFIIIYIIINGLQDYFKNPLTGLSIGILVGLGFGLYENIIYIQNGVTDVKTIIFRALLVGGILLHPLTCGIYGYMIMISNKLPHILPKVFIKLKSGFKGITGMVDLINFIFINSGKSIKIVIDFIKRILILDVTIKYILGDSDKSDSGYGHGPAEIIYEGLLLGIWIHVLYNTVLTHIIEPYIMLKILAIFVILILIRLFICLYDSKLLGNVICGIIALGFFTGKTIGYNLSILSLIFLILTLSFLSYQLHNKLKA